MPETPECVGIPGVNEEYLQSALPLISIVSYYHNRIVFYHFQAIFDKETRAVYDNLISLRFRLLQAS